MFDLPKQVPARNTFIANKEKHKQKFMTFIGVSFTWSHIYVVVVFVTCYRFFNRTHRKVETQLWSINKKDRKGIEPFIGSSVLSK